MKELKLLNNSFVCTRNEIDFYDFYLRLSLSLHVGSTGTAKLVPGHNPSSSAHPILKTPPIRPFRYSSFTYRETCYALEHFSWHSFSLALKTRCRRRLTSTQWAHSVKLVHCLLLTMGSMSRNSRKLISNQLCDAFRHSDSRPSLCAPAENQSHRLTFLAI